MRSKNSYKIDPTLEYLHLPPHSVEAEASLLGALMIDNNVWERLGDRLVEADFYRQDHRLIFRAIANLANAGTPFDAVMLADWFKSQDLLETVGGMTHLAALARDTPTAANAEVYARVVSEHALCRRLLSACTTIVESVQARGDQPAAAIIEAAEQRIYALSDGSAAKRECGIPIDRLAAAAIDRIDTLMQAGTSVTGLSTGLERLDQLTAGLQPGDLVIVAGRPSMGKSALALGIAAANALRPKDRIPTLYFSLEMSGEQIAMRMISMLGGVNLMQVRTGQIADADWVKVSNALAAMSNAPMYVEDSGALNPTELRIFQGWIYFVAVFGSHVDGS